MSTTLRLLADDLTGALDTSAEFVGLVGPVFVTWTLAGAGFGVGAGPPPGNLGLDTGTRELGDAEACDVVVGLVPVLADAAIAFKKIDSLIRGQTLPELAAIMRSGRWDRAVLAPAFPFQGRVTRGGRQWAAGAPVGPELSGALRALGVAARSVPPGAGLPPGVALPPGVSVFDAETDADLEEIVAGVGDRCGVLWCGTGGLARALCAGCPPPSPPPLPRPVLGLFGSDQAVTFEQLALCGPHWDALPDGGADGGAAGVARLAARLDRYGVGLASIALPAGVERGEAARRIADGLGALARRLPKPGTLAVAGGETLRGLCLALGASGLLVRGRAMPGVPVSTLVGGVWGGVTVLSKSGAFGHPTLLRDLLVAPELRDLVVAPERTRA